MTLPKPSPSSWAPSRQERDDAILSTDCRLSNNGDGVGYYVRDAQHFRSHGYSVIRGLLREEEVDMLQTECGRLMEMAAERAGACADKEWAAKDRGCIFQALPCCNEPQEAAVEHRLREPGPAAGAAGFQTDLKMVANGNDYCYCRAHIDADAYDKLTRVVLMTTTTMLTTEFIQRRSKWPCETGVCQLLIGQKLASVASAMLCSEEVWLYNDQYIAKPAGSKLAAFRWHRDSDWCKKDEFDYFPYVSVWCALDDMDEGNGTLVIKPDSSVKISSTHFPRDDSSSPAGVGDNESGCLGSPLEEQQDCGLRVMNVKAGDAVVMSDRVLHSSGPNLSGFTRSAWMPQFSSGPIMQCGTRDPVSLALRVIKHAD